MKRLLLILCLSSSATFAQTQTHQIDSLKRGLARLEKQPLSTVRDSVAYLYISGLMQGYTPIQTDSALVYNARLIQLCKRQNYEFSLIEICSFTSYLYLLKGNQFERIRWLYKALVIAEKRNAYPNIASIYSSLAHAHFSLKNYPKSLDFCEKGLALLKKYPDANTEMAILNVYGTNYEEKNDYQKALQQYLKCYYLAKANKSTWYEAQSLNEIGWTWQGLNQLDKAADYYQKALPLARKTGNADLESNILISLTSLLMKQQKWAEALQYSRTIRARSISMKNTPLLLDIQKKQYEIYKKLGRTRESLNTYEHYIVLKDSLSRETSENRIEALQAQYKNVQQENKLKKQQVLLLSQQNRNQQLAQTRNGLFGGVFAVLLVAGLLFWNNRRLQSKNRQISQQSMLLERAREQLATVNQSLEVRVQERTHELLEANETLIRRNEEIKGALFKGQTIERKRVAIELHDNLSSLLSALNMSIQGIDPKGLSEKEQTVYQNIRHMMTNAYAEVRNISHNILPTDLEQEGLCNVLAGLVAKLNENTPIQFTFRTTLTDRLPTEIEFNLYSIVLELINNVIRHAKATQATIELNHTGVGIYLVITDNGRGLNTESKRGMGLQNIQSRLDALGGSFAVAANQPRGTITSLQIPVDALVPTVNL